MVTERLEKVFGLMESEISKLQVEKRIRTRVKSALKPGKNRSTPIVLYLRHPHYWHTQASTGLSEEPPKKRRRTEVSACSNWQAWCPSAGTISKIDVG